MTRHGTQLYLSRAQSHALDQGTAMKTSFIFLICACSGFVRLVDAQGSLAVSNLGQTSTASAFVANNSWIAQVINVGANTQGYILNSVQLLMGAASGNPSGFSVSVYSKSGDPHSFAIPGDFPQNNLGGLSGSEPVTGGVFSYSTTGIFLSPSTWYFVVATAATASSQGAYTWSACSGSTQGNGFEIENDYFSSNNGSSWTAHLRQNVFQLGISATAVPEPTPLVLFGLGGSFLFTRLARKFRSKALRQP